MDQQGQRPLLRRLSVNAEPFRERREAELAALSARMDEGEGGFALARQLSAALDALVASMIEAVQAEAGVVPCALYATGSYGQSRVCPRSDLDLLVVYDPTTTDREALGSFCGGLQTLLRDVGFRVGMAARTPSECGALAQEDHTIAASMMDARLLRLEGGGVDLGFAPERLGLEVARLLRRDDGGRTFALTVREGMRQRHHRYGQTVYWLEPDLKNGHGGLRDMGALQWTATALFGVRELEAIAATVGAGADEVAAVRAAVDFMLRVRTALHLTGGRFANDRLTFEHQEKIALRLGYGAQAGASGGGRGLLPVEVFMQSYYRSAQVLASWSRIWQDVWLLPEEDSPPVSIEPGLCVRQRSVDLTRGQDRAVREPISPLQASGEDAASSSGSWRAITRRADGLSDPARGLVASNPLRVFEAALDLGLPPHPLAAVSLSRELGAGRAELGQDAALSLRRLLCSLESPDELIRAVAELGLLLGVLPEFEPIEALAQHDVYHVYTVDAHLRGCLRAGKDLLRGASQGSEDLPFIQIGAAVPSHRREVLLLACLLHDVGKGRGGDHSVIGGGLVRDIGPRLCLTASQTAHLAFLVEQHLLLPRVSQRRDLSDEETIRDVALQVRTLQALDDLTLLAVADMRAVGPQNFTPWKAHLLAELYQRVRYALENGVDALWRVAEARGGLRAEVEARLTAADHAVSLQLLDRFLAAMPLRYLLATSPGALVRHVRAYARAEAEGAPAYVELHDAEGATTELIVFTQDRPGTLVTLAGVLAAHDVNILSAQIASDDAGRALDVFALQSSAERPLEATRRETLAAALRAGLAAGLDSAPGPPVARTRSGLPPRQSPDIPTVVAVDQTTSRRYTIVEVKARDRPGLLWAIARYFFTSGHNIHLSKINTEGERAVDAFYIERLDAACKLTDSEAHAVREGLQAALDTWRAEG